MTAKELREQLRKVPDYCVVMSNSGWERDPTDIDGVWYYPEGNEVHLTRGGKYEAEDGYKPDWGYPGEFVKVYCKE